MGAHERNGLFHVTDDRRGYVTNVTLFRAIRARAHVMLSYMSYSYKSYLYMSLSILTCTRGTAKKWLRWLRNTIYSSFIGGI